MSVLAAEQVRLERALDDRRVALGMLREAERVIAAHECKRTARARERAMTSEVARTKVFRDGAPRDLPQHREIARRYAWLTHKVKWIATPLKHASVDRRMTLIRMRELERIFSSRYGAELPDDDAGRDDLNIAAHHIAHMGSDAERHIVAWAALWAPWMAAEQAAALAARVIAKPVKFSADTLAWRLGLTAEERARLAITTIGAIDQNKGQRAKARKLKRQAAERARRRARGAMPRQEYEATSLTKARPWEALGISRATWYRRGKLMGGLRPQWEGSRTICRQAERSEARKQRISATKPAVRQVRGQQVSFEYMDSREPVSAARCGPGFGGSPTATTSTRSSRAEPARMRCGTAPLVHDQPQAQQPTIFEAKSASQPSQGLPTLPSTLANPLPTVADPRKLSQPSQTMGKHLKVRELKRRLSNAERRRARAERRLAQDLAQEKDDAAAGPSVAELCAWFGPHDLIRWGRFRR